MTALSHHSNGHTEQPGRDGVTATAEADPNAIGPVQTSYAPDRDGDPDPGEIVWTWVPYENNDGRLSRDEFERSMVTNFVDGDRFDTLFEPAARAVVRALDLDGDGQVDRQEFKVFQDAFGRSETHCATAFGKLDRDGDGQLTVGELPAATREYYTSADPDAVGNFLFGEPC